MFWDKISPIYDLFENVYNGKVYSGTGKKVAEMIDPSDVVLECACGTGAISIYIAPKCRKLIATDFARGMLRQAAKKCRKYPNAIFRRADITNINCKDNRFDKVVAGNVIHLLPEPAKALQELERVVKPGGKIIIPTYINMSKRTGTLAVKFITLLGAEFKRQFDLESYKRFFEEQGYANVDYCVVDGRMPCAIAVITKKTSQMLWSRIGPIRPENARNLLSLLGLQSFIVRVRIPPSALYLYRRKSLFYRTSDFLQI